MNNQVTLQDAAKIIDRLGRYFPMLVRNGSEVVNDWYPFIAQFPLDVAQAAAMYVIENTAFDPTCCFCAGGQNVAATSNRTA